MLISANETPWKHIPYLATSLSKWDLIPGTLQGFGCCFCSLFFDLQTTGFEIPWFLGMDISAHETPWKHNHFLSMVIESKYYADEVIENPYRCLTIWLHAQEDLFWVTGKYYLGLKEPKTI